MSKAFTKEDLDPPERPRRTRSASGLPPGATNYITPAGLARLRRELAQLRRSDADQVDRITQLKRVIESVVPVEPSGDSDIAVGFGSRVTVLSPGNRETVYRILGIEELDRDPDAISWISPIGRTLLTAKLGDRVTLAETGTATIVKIEHPAE